MFGSKHPNYTKLRTNLRLCINRLKLLEKKKAELALKARKEIADYIQMGKEDRARIRVEHIVREDYLVEAMEIVEMLCDLILARFGLIERMKEMDPGLEESIATIIWVTPRLSSDIAELAMVSNQFALKYGKEYAEACRKNAFENVNEKVIHKLSLAAPPALLIENYMVEIARSFKVPFEPDPLVMAGDSIPDVVDLLGLGDDDKKPPDEKPGFGGGGGGGGGGMPAMPIAPTVYPDAPGPMQPPPTVVHPATPGAPGFSYPGPPAFQGQNPGAPAFTVPGSAPAFTMPGGSVLGTPGAPAHSPGHSPGAPPLPSKPPNASQGNSPAGSAGSSPANTIAARGNNQPPHLNISEPPVLPGYDDVINSPTQYPHANGPSLGPGQAPPPQNTGPPSLGLPQVPGRAPSPNLALPDVPGLPSVPSSTVGTTGGDDVDFDDLTRRFEELKKRK